jgi:hypothetical protein
MCLQKKLFDLEDANCNTTLEEYNKVLFKKNQLVNLKYLSENYLCEIVKVNELGELVVIVDSKTKTFKFGDVEWIL